MQNVYIKSVLPERLRFPTKLTKPKIHLHLKPKHCSNTNGKPTEYEVISL